MRRRSFPVRVDGRRALEVPAGDSRVVVDEIGTQEPSRSHLLVQP
jgi:hypothetical protein